MTNFNLNTFRDQPDEAGRFGIHGGRFVAETLMPLILDVEKAYNEARIDKLFLSEMTYYQKHYIGRPSPLYLAERMTAHFGGAKLYLKRDELNHTGAHKINNVLGQALLAKRMGKTKIIAETIDKLCCKMLSYVSKCALYCYTKFCSANLPKYLLLTIPFLFVYNCCVLAFVDHVVGHTF